MCAPVCGHVMHRAWLMSPAHLSVRSLPGRADTTRFDDDEQIGPFIVIFFDRAVRTGDMNLLAALARGRAVT
jgi:hypothetical protein